MGTRGVCSGRVDAPAVASGALRLDRRFRPLHPPEDASGILEAGPVSDVACAGGRASFLFPGGRRTPRPARSVMKPRLGSVQSQLRSDPGRLITPLRGRVSMNSLIIKLEYPWQDNVRNMLISASVVVLNCFSDFIVNCIEIGSLFGST